MGILAAFMSFLGVSPGKDSIRVEFINAKDKSVFARSDMPAQQLPDTFAIDTTLTIKGKQWSVVSAEPMDKPSFTKTGKLKVVLSPITLSVPEDILFSLATISDDVGAATGTDIPGPEIFSIHEDDWRQIEFVSAKFKTELAQELEDIKNIYKDEREGVGFKKVHVRKRIPNPLNGVSLPLLDLEKSVNPLTKFKAVGFLRSRGTIPQSFAWELSPDVVIWGVTDVSGNILRLCLSWPLKASSGKDLSEAVSSFTAKYKLTFVDWVKAIEIDGDPKAFASYFETITSSHSK